MTEDARPDLDAPFIGVAIADYVHILFREFNDAFFLKLLNGLNDSWIMDQLAKIGTLQGP